MPRITMHLFAHLIDLNSDFLSQTRSPPCLRPLSIYPLNCHLAPASSVPLDRVYPRYLVSCAQDPFKIEAYDFAFFLRPLSPFFMSLSYSPYSAFQYAESLQNPARVIYIPRISMHMFAITSIYHFSLSRHPSLSRGSEPTHFGLFSSHAYLQMTSQSRFSSGRLRFFLAIPFTRPTFQRSKPTQKEDRCLTSLRSSPPSSFNCPFALLGAFHGQSQPESSFQHSFCSPSEYACRMASAFCIKRRKIRRASRQLKHCSYV
jgi:hypothetical protein